MIILILASLLVAVCPIRFSCSLLPGQTQCFYEMVEKHTRFQIIARSSAAEVQVNIFTPTGSVSNLVDPEMFEKSYAGFSDDNDQVHFCLTNPTNSKSKSLIQFYHGLNVKYWKRSCKQSER